MSTSAGKEVGKDLGGILERGEQEGVVLVAAGVTAVAYWWKRRSQRWGSSMGGGGGQGENYG